MSFAHSAVWARRAVRASSSGPLPCSQPGRLALAWSGPLRERPAPPPAPTMCSAEFCTSPPFPS
eukprot:3285815-Lingulodinium_polyedra.AAC.1